MMRRSVLAMVVIAAMACHARAADAVRWEYATLQYTDVTEDSYYFDEPSGRQKGYAGYSAIGGKLSRKEWDGTGYAGRIRAFALVIGDRGWELTGIESKGSPIGTIYWFKRQAR